MATYEFPSIRDIQAYGRASMQYPSMGPLTQGRGMDLAVLNAPRGGGRKPRLKLTNSGEIRILGVDDAAVFFAPLNPLQPVAQMPAAQALRPWDYPVGYNTRVTPRSGYTINFPTLKALADGYDVLRILIERVKDKIVYLPWAILPKDHRKKADSRCELLEAFFVSPDRRHNFSDWLRMLLEQVIVYDAPLCYLRNTRGGDLWSAEVFDGSLLTPKIMADGRAPPPDMGPAYQYILKGLMAIDAVLPVPKGQPVPVDPAGNPYPEFLYKPRNPRVDSPYGFSPVEQIITTINIGIRQETWLQSFYTDGSQPDVAFSTPGTWTTQEIANFKVWWDSVLAGNLQTRRGTMFLPDGAKIFDFKAGALQDAQTVEWLIRLMCFSLGLNPMAFIKQMNRGQEQTHHEEAQQEGLEPWLNWVKGFIQTIIEVKFGWDDLEFRFEEDDAVDPLDQAKIDEMNIVNGVYHPDEIRANRGDDPMEQDLRDQMAMVAYRNAPNANVLPESVQDAQDEREAKKQAAMPKPEPAQPNQPAQPAPAQKIDNHFKLDAPVITLPPITIAPPSVNVTTPPVNVTLPEMKAGDIFMDIGATNVKVDAPKQDKETSKVGLPETTGIGKLGPIERAVTATRNKDGTLSGKITYSRSISATGTKDESGKPVVKIQE